jgi:hypothetical protein
MKADGIVSLPLYHEGRLCKAPTANRVFELFQDVRRHRLVSPKAVMHKTFYDALSELQRTVLYLLGQTPAAYFSAGEQRA